MKKILALVLALSMVAICAVGCGPAKKELVIGYTDYAPMNYTDENGNLIGFDTELAKAVCEKLGYTPKFQLIDWNNNTDNSVLNGIVVAKP